MKLEQADIAICSDIPLAECEISARCLQPVRVHRSERQNFKVSSSDLSPNVNVGPTWRTAPGKGCQKPANQRVDIDRIYREFFPILVTKLKRVFGNGPPEAEDLVQEAFAKFAATDRYHTVRYPKALIFRIALNMGFNTSKRMTVARRYVDQSIREAHAMILEEISPEDVYCSKEELSLLLQAAEKLSDKQRQLISRHRINGETYAQIGADTGWSSSDISRQLKTALCLLLNEMDKSYERPR